MRAVAYYTQYGGFVDALGPAGGENVNDGHRAGGRIALRSSRRRASRITPRILYQEIRANGFNRQEVYNLYANPFTTPPIASWRAPAISAAARSFADNTLLADLNVSIELGPVTLTSVTTYINRDIVVSRDASALTGSVSVDPASASPGVVRLPSNLVDTTDLETLAQEVRMALGQRRAVQVA